MYLIYYIVKFTIYYKNINNTLIIRFVLIIQDILMVYDNDLSLCVITFILTKMCHYFIHTLEYTELSTFVFFLTA